MATIYRRGKTWWGRVQRSGADIRRSLKTTAEGVARKRLADWVREIDAEGFTGQSPRLFDDAAERFTREHLPALKPNSSARYNTSLDHLAPHFEGKQLRKIGTADLSAFETARRLAGASAPTIRRDFACLSSLFGDAIDWEWVDANPVPAYLKRGKRRGLRESASRTRFLSHTEEKRLLAHCSPHVRDAVEFALDTGLRREEQFGLQWSQVSLETREIMLTAGTKNSKPRRVPIRDRALAVLSKTPAKEREGFVFRPGPKGKRDRHKPRHRFNNLQKGLKSASKRATVADLRWHDLRRTCGCRLIQDKGFSLAEVRDWLGHSSVVVTERAYAFLAVDALHKKAGTAQKPAQGRRIHAKKDAGSTA